jgi:cytochrome b561
MPTAQLSVHPVLRYTRVAVALHWVIAAMMLVNVLLGLFAESLPDDWMRA